MKTGRNEIAKAILLAIAAAGALVILPALPGLAAALKPFLKNKKYNRTKLKRSLKSLETQGLVVLGEKGDKIVVEITEDGKKKTAEYKLDDIKIFKPKRWDRKWRVVIFDVPESLKMYRRGFMFKLKELGFKLVQRSVWVCPFPCEKEINILKKAYFVGPYVQHILAEDIENKEALMKYFDLT